jgi:hypothetical protein
MRVRKRRREQGGSKRGEENSESAIRCLVVQSWDLETFLKFPVTQLPF